MRRKRFGGACQQAGGHLVLAHRRPVFNTLVGNQMDLRVVAAHGARARPDVIGDDPVRSFSPALGVRVLNQILGLGGKADDEARARAPGFESVGENVRVERQREHGLGALVRLLELMRRIVGRAPIGDSSGADRNVGGERGLHGGQHLVCGVDFCHAHALRVGKRHRPAHQSYLAPSAAAARASAWPCLPEERLAI